MSIVLITGSCGLVGSESVKFFTSKGFDVIGIDNNFRQKFFGKDGFSLFESGGSKESGSSGGGGIGVNSFLWRASLDTIAFMPLLSADPFGGVIITDWYGPPESQGERFKLNIFILGTSLRSDGVRATVFKQTKGKEGSWMDASRDEKLDRDVEDSILTRARELKINSLPQR